jgi:hypothetical protein
VIFHKTDYPTFALAFAVLSDTTSAQVFAQAMSVARLTGAASRSVAAKAIRSWHIGPQRHPPRCRWEATPKISFHSRSKCEVLHIAANRWPPAGPNRRNKSKRVTPRNLLTDYTSHRELPKRPAMLSTVTERSGPRGGPSQKKERVCSQVLPARSQSPRLLVSCSINLKCGPSDRTRSQLAAISYNYLL